MTPGLTSQQRCRFDKYGFCPYKSVLSPNKSVLSPNNYVFCTYNHVFFLKETMIISIIAALSENGAIGNKNQLIYRLPNDMKRFKTLTTGHTIVMGRKTFESFPKGALPNRRNIVLSRSEDFSPEGAEVFRTLPDALQSCGEDEEVFVIGGASIYRQAMPLADRLYLTFVENTPEEADTFFPAIDYDKWIISNEEVHEADEKHAYRYCFTDFVRKQETGSDSVTSQPLDESQGANCAYKDRGAG